MLFRRLERHTLQTEVISRKIKRKSQSVTFTLKLSVSAVMAASPEASRRREKNLHGNYKGRAF